MNILDFALSDTDLWLLGVAGVLIMLFLGVYVPAAINRRNQASTEFRQAFESVTLNLRENPNCPIAQIAFGFHNEHLSAITKFRDAVPIWKRRSFDRSIAHYKEAYDIARDYGSVFAVALSEKTDIAHEKRKHYSEAIQRLLSYA